MRDRQSGTEFREEPLALHTPGSGDVTPTESVQEFLAALRRSKRELDIARQQFDSVVDPLLIDHVVFRLGAAERHFNYLFQLARRWNLALEDMDWYWAERAE
ncbi:hypothetical protein GCM10025857_19280 [Alicyclobacillus contaminans]|uniref:DUF2508 family protein n=1 Tax=Alicyclobacillus contaminans TaxID=392016 RepID=UPI0004217BDA|nr:DUF2508 family protein [Alicyclobacillus contaminans]GMA50571.1 hypothetical protein GCM10025857_19280 [Alicyclobacillus contaminans]